MRVEQSPDVKFEIGHVLFIDIVGYSNLLISEQTTMLKKLKEIVRGTEEFRAAKAEGKLLALPTGDGGALVFRTSSRSGGPVRDRDWQRTQTSSPAAGANGHLQRPSQ